MSFNRKIWLSWTTKKPCPSCKTGTLEFPKKGSYLRSETEDSKEMNSHGGYYSDYVFSIHFACSNCNETVVVAGYMSEENYPSDENIGIQKAVNPLFFYPAPKIIEIPPSCPKSVNKILEETFALFWLDIPSCANKIRVAIEVLLNELNIPQTLKKGNKEIDLTLHSRLELFEKVNSAVATVFMAIKWIGNSGSHHSSITRDDVLDAYELLEFSLEKLYSDRELRLMKLSQEINRAKKPIKR